MVYRTMCRSIMIALIMISGQLLDATAETSYLFHHIICNDLSYILLTIFNALFYSLTLFTYMPEILPSTSAKSKR